MVLSCLVPLMAQQCFYEIMRNLHIPARFVLSSRCGASKKSEGAARVLGPTLYIFCAALAGLYATHFPCRARVSTYLMLPLDMCRGGGRQAPSVHSPHIYMRDENGFRFE